MHSKIKILLASLLFILPCTLFAQIYIGADGIPHSSISKGIILSNEGKGTPKSVQTIVQRNAIADTLRFQGMTCFVIDSLKKYILKTGTTNSDWAEDALGTSGGGNPNTNLGAAYRIGAGGNNLRSLRAGYGMVYDTANSGEIRGVIDTGVILSEPGTVIAGGVYSALVSGGHGYILPDMQYVWGNGNNIKANGFITYYSSDGQISTDTATGQKGYNLDAQRGILTFNSRVRFLDSLGMAWYQERDSVTKRVGSVASSGGSGGTVTSVSALSGIIVANATTTPQLSLGNITPTSVSATGNVTGNNLSGTNTGDETQGSIKSKLGAASSSQDGYLTQTDWNTFNNKISTQYFQRNGIILSPATDGDRLSLNDAGTTADNGYNAKFGITRSTTFNQYQSFVKSGTIPVSQGFADATNLWSIGFAQATDANFDTTNAAVYWDLVARKTTVKSFRIKDGTQGAGKFLNSDANGNASWVTIDKSTVGLGNVDNTSDANKPVSTPQQTALNGKINYTDTTSSVATKTDLSKASIQNIAYPVTSLSDTFTIAALSGKTVSAVYHNGTRLSKQTTYAVLNVNQYYFNGTGIKLGLYANAGDTLDIDYGGLVVSGGGGLSNITGLVQQGTNVTVTGSGTSGSPYVINAASSTPASNIITSGLLAEYRFDEGGGTTLTDYSGNGNTGSYVGSPTFIAGGGFTANGVTKYATGTTGAISTAQTIYIVCDVAPDNTNIYHAIMGNSGGTANLNIVQCPIYNKQGFPGASVWANNGVAMSAPFDVTPTTPYVIAITIDGSNSAYSKIYYDGVEVASYATQSLGIASLRSGTPWFGATNTGSTGGFNGNIYYLSSYSTLQTSQQIQANSIAIRQYLTNRGTPLAHAYNSTNTIANIMGMGDSIDFGFNATSFLQQLSTKLTSVNIYNKGWPGINSQQEKYSVAGLSKLYFSPLAGWNIATILLGANDYGTYSPQQTVEAIQSMCTQLRKDGWKVIVCTEIDRGDASTAVLTSYFASASALIRSNWRRFADELCDFNAEPLLGAVGASSNTTYFQSDKIHPTTTGQALMAGYMSAAINRMVSSYGNESLSNPLYVQAGTATVTNINAEISVIGSSAINNSGLNNQVIVGATSSGSATVTGMTGAIGLVIGQSVTGTGIPAGTTVSSITSNTTIVLSQNATVSGTAALTFSKVGVKAYSWVPGRSWHIEQRGLMSTDASPGTLNRQIKWGSVVLGNTGAIAPTASISNSLYKMEAEITCTGVGSSATFWIEGTLTINGSVYPLKNTGTVSFNASADALFDITDTWTAASANNIDQSTNLTITQRN